MGEGNGNPLQYSCLENPRDGGAWWAAVYRVAQSQTRLKPLSSSSSSSRKPEGVGQVQPMGPWKMNVTRKIRILPYSHGETLEVVFFMFFVFFFKENSFVLVGHGFVLK